MAARLSQNAMPNNPSYTSSVVNGQLVPVFSIRGVFPSQAAAPYLYGNGAKPATLAGFSAARSPLSLASGTTGYGGGGDLAAAGAAEPFNPRTSPTLWAVGFLIVGLLGLRHIHWKAD